MLISRKGKHFKILATVLPGQVLPGIRRASADALGRQIQPYRLGVGSWL